MKKFLLGGLAAAGLLLGGLTIANSASASDTSHVLVVNGVSYNSYKETAADPNDPNDIGTVQWQTPNVTTSAIVTFAERNQTWNGVNGAKLLPCQFGVHWISNGSVLTISHCLAETEATTTTSTTSTTTTTICVDCGVNTVVITQPSTTATTAPPSESTTTTTIVASGGPVPPAAAPPAAAPPAAAAPALVSPAAAVNPTQTLPSTGSSSWGTALIALAALLGGFGLVKLSRRSS